MAHSFDNELANDQLSVRFFVTIDGIGAIFMDGPIFNPTASATTAWSAPTSKGQAYTLKPYTLDTTDRLATVGQEILRREGKSSPGSMTITLKDDRTNYLLDLFARDKNDAKTARIFEYMGTSGMNYDTTGAGTSIWCVDGELAGWPVPTLAYVGRETIYVPDINTGKSTLGGPVDAMGDADNCTRDLFSVGSSDLRYTPNTNMANRPRIISTHPRVWHNRIVRVFAVLCDRNGYALTQAVSSFSDWTSDTNHVREIWRGTLQNNPEPDDTLTRWSLRLRSIDSLLHSSVGRDAIEGTLVRVGSTYSNANDEGKMYTPEGAPTNFPQVFFVTESTTSFDVQLTDVDTGKTATIQHAMFSAGSVIKMSDIHNELIGDFQTAVRALVVDGVTPFDDVSVSLLEPSKTDGQVQLWYYRLYFSRPTGSDPLSVVCDFAAANSWGKLLNFIPSGGQAAGVGAVQMFQSYTGGGSLNWGGTQTAAYIGPEDTTIPFFRRASGGMVADQPPASGSAVLGEEVINYGSISSLATTMEGLYTLNNCTRGQLGTKAALHRVSYDIDGQAVGDPVKLKFVTAFSDTSIFDAILQLATSTGAEHHGAHDVLAHGIGPSMPPEHFDLGSFSNARDGLGLMPWEHRINYYFDKPTKLMDLAAKWLKPLGFFIHARVGPSGAYQIGISQANPPMESGAFQTITAANMAADDFAVWQPGADLIVNEVAVKWLFDVKEGEIKDDQIIARDQDSISDFGVKGRTSLELLGYQWGYTTAIAHVHTWAHRIFARYGAPYDLLTIEVDRVGWSVRVGDTILLTVPLVPNTEGSRGLEYRACTVLATKHRYHAPRGKPGSSLTVALENVIRRSVYCPSARGASYDAGVPSITVAANAYTDAAVATDAEHFSVGDEIRITNEGNATVTDDRTIAGISGNVITLSAALSSVTFSASTTVISAQEYSAVQEQQQHTVYLSTLTDGGADTTPFKYV